MSQTIEWYFIIETLILLALFIYLFIHLNALLTQNLLNAKHLNTLFYLIL